MNKREFTDFVNNVYDRINEEIKLLYDTLEEKKDNENWKHSDWLHLAWKTESYIEGLDSALKILAKSKRLPYKGIDREFIETATLGTNKNMRLEHI